MADEWLTLVISIVWWSICGLLFLAFIWFRKYNPYWMRKYYTVIVKTMNPDGTKSKKIETKGWYIKEGKIEYFRVMFKGFAGFFKGVNFDRSFGKCIDAQGNVSIVEKVPDKYEESNYAPEFPPLTQQERFEADLQESVITPLCVVQVKNDKGEVEKAIDGNALEISRLRVRELLHKHSRMVDSEESAWLGSSIETTRRQRERGAGDDWIMKYGPIIVIVFAIVFAWLMIDNSLKSFQSTIDKSMGMYENMVRQMVVTQGGTYQPYAPPVQNTSNNFPIPLVQG